VGVGLFIPASPLEIWRAVSTRERAVRVCAVRDAYAEVVCQAGTQTDTNSLWIDVTKF